MDIFDRQRAMLPRGSTLMRMDDFMQRERTAMMHRVQAHCNEGHQPFERVLSQSGRSFFNAIDCCGMNKHIVLPALQQAGLTHGLHVQAHRYRVIQPDGSRGDHAFVTFQGAKRAPVGLLDGTWHQFLRLAATLDKSSPEYDAFCGYMAEKQGRGEFPSVFTDQLQIVDLSVALMRKFPAVFRSPFDWDYLFRPWGRSSPSPDQVAEYERIRSRL